MATTTNYGWVTPDDTDLVKDGAAAIRTLGSSVDTSFVDLLGGTTGQVLTKASATDLDFTFAAPASSGMTLLNSGGTTLSGATVTISSIPATFIDLYIVAVNYRPTNDNDTLAMFFNGDDAATKYSRPGSSLYGTSQSFTDSNLNFVLEQDNGATSSAIATATIKAYTATTFKKVLVESITNNATTPANVNCRLFYGMSNITAAISSITFKGASNCVSGTVFVYGVK